MTMGMGIKMRMRIRMRIKMRMRMRMMKTVAWARKRGNIVAETFYAMFPHLNVFLFTGP